MTDLVNTLRLLRQRINEKEPLGVYDICLVEDAISEIKRLRQSEATLEAEIRKESSISNIRTKG